MAGIHEEKLHEKYFRKYFSDQTDFLS